MKTKDIKKYIADNKKVLILGGIQNTCKKILNLLNEKLIQHKYLEKINKIEH